MAFPSSTPAATLRAIISFAAVLAAGLIFAATPAPASGNGDADLDPDVALCLEAWQAEHDAHGGGALTLFEHEVRERPTYKIVVLTLGSGEGRLIDGKCRIKDGEVTHTYE